MQTQGGAAAAAVIEGRERHFRRVVMFDWTKSGNYDHPLSDVSRYVSEVSVDRKGGGLLPTDLGGDSGGEAAQLTVTMGGAEMPPVVVDGVEMSIVEVFAPYANNGLGDIGEIVNCQCYWDIEVDTADGTVAYRQFIGNIRTPEIDRVAGTVKITALDRIEWLRSEATMAPWAIAGLQENQGQVTGQIQNPQGYINGALQQSYTSATPFVPPTEREVIGVPPTQATKGGVHLWIPGTGTITPSVGFRAITAYETYPKPEDDGVEMFVHRGPLHPDAPDPSIVPLCVQGKQGTKRATSFYRFMANNPNKVSVDGAVHMGFTLGTRNANWAKYKGLIAVMTMGRRLDGATQPQSIAIQADGTGRMQALYAPSGDSSTWASGEWRTVPTAKQWVRIDFGFEFSTEGRIRFCDTMVTDTGVKQTNGWAWVQLAVDFDKSWTEARGYTLVYDGVDWTDFYTLSQNWSLPPADSGDVTRKTARYAASLDPGINQITYTPDSARGSTEAAELVQTIAEAEQGMVQWDEEGRFLFWNRDRIALKRQTPVKTLTADELSEISLAASMDDVRNDVRFTETIKRAASYAVIYQGQDQDEFFVPANTNRNFHISADAVQYGGFSDWYASSRVVPVTPENWRAKHDTYTAQSICVPQWNVPGIGYTSSPNGSMPQVYIGSYLAADGSLQLRIENGPYPWNLRLAVADADASQNDINYSSSGALNLIGVVINDGGTSVDAISDEDSIDEYQRRLLAIEGDWVQDYYPADRFAGTVLPTIAKPRPTSQDVTAPGDPRIQLCDAMSVVDDRGVGRFRIQVTGITRTDNDGGLADTYRVEVYTPEAASYSDFETQYSDTTYDDFAASETGLTYDQFAQSVSAEAI